MRIGRTCRGSAAAHGSGNGHNRHMNVINRRRSIQDWISQQSSQIPWNGWITQARTAFQDQFQDRERVIRARALEGRCGAVVVDVGRESERVSECVYE